jgi:hypothetical protein
MIRRMALLLMLVLLASAMVPAPATAAPTQCEGLFYGIEASCMLRLGGSNVLVFGAAYRNDNPPAQIIVELWKWPVSVNDDPLARCDTDGGVLRECQHVLTGTALPLNTMMLCRITGIGEIGAFACASF